jgi:serine/threonine protein kinase
LREIGELKHSHLLGIEEVYDSDSSFYIVMELCGKDLLKGRVGEGSREEKVRSAMRQLLSGLTALHDRGVVHRDIKPNNIMFREDGRFELVITDFGLAMHLEEDHPFVQCGTPGFVAPEVFLLTGNQGVKDCACDVFSMGVVFHILLTGQPLFKGETPKDLFIKNSKMDFDLNQ